MAEGISRDGRNVLYFAKVGAAVRKSRQAVTYRKGGRSCPVVTARLVEDMGEMIGHGFLTQPQYLGNLAIALPLDNELEHCDLAPGQVGRERRREGMTRLMRKSAELSTNTAY